MSGTFKSVDGNTMTFDDNSQHAIAPNATVTRNSKPAKLTDLKAGDSVSLSGDPATSVTATG